MAEVRKDNGDTQERLAEKLNATVFAVRCWEQEKSSPSHDMLVTICRLYGVSADYLLGISNTDPAYENRRRKTRLSEEDQVQLRLFEEFLGWKKGQKA